MNKKRFILIALYLIALILPCAFYIADSIGSKPTLILSGVFGIMAYVILTFQLLLVSRPKLIDKYFGLDRIYRFHMVIAVLALIFVYIHKLLKGMYFSESGQTELGDIAFNIFIGISIFSILMMINKLFFKFKPIDYIRKLLSKIIKLKHQYKVLVHNIMVIALILVFIHVILAYTFESILPLKIILLTYFAVPMISYFNHKILKLFLHKNKRFTVSEIINESGNIITLKFRPNHGKIFKYLPGQFLYVKLKNPKIPGDEHPFTISSSPAQSEYVSVTVKQLGDFTNSLKNAKVGDRAYIDGAFGSFSYLKQKESKKLCFIAGGIGITPFLGMINHMKAVPYDKEVILLWGARDLSEVICKNELEDYAIQQKNFRFVPVLSNDAVYDGEKGFITSDLIKKYLENVLDYDFYICGPPIMMEIQLKNLKSLGVPKKNIHYERFSL